MVRTRQTRSGNISSSRSGVFLLTIPPLNNYTPLVYYNLRPVGRRKFRYFPCTFKTISNFSRAYWERCETVFDKKISFLSLKFLKIFACGALSSSIVQWYKPVIAGKFYNTVWDLHLLSKCLLYNGTSSHCHSLFIFCSIRAAPSLKAPFPQW